MQRSQEKSGELDAALDQASEQLRDMSPDEIVDQEDLAWSFPSGVYVEPEVVSSEPLVIEQEIAFSRPPRSASLLVGALATWIVS